MNKAERSDNMENKLKEQVERINEVVLSYANLDFSHRAHIEGHDDVIDSLAAGINMLGEELQHSTVSLKEKEVLLKEVHHRVKNNLQIISSILNLQSEFAKSRSEKRTLSECKNRIMSMALLHEKLYQSENLEKIEISDYIKSILTNLEDTLSDDYIKLEFESKMRQENSNIDFLIPVGLILNELITNSIEHAFEKDTSGVIKVTIEKNDGVFTLIVQDNGKGFNPIAELAEKKLGMQLIDALVEQIQGSFNYNFDSGTSAELHFKIGD